MPEGTVDGQIPLPQDLELTRCNAPYATYQREKTFEAETLSPAYVRGSLVRSTGQTIVEGMCR
jgi:hypothetical protein